VIGFGLVTNTSAHWLTWQGYLLDPLGLGGKSGAWAGADLGVVVAILIGFVGTLFTRNQIRAQEALPLEDPRGVAAPISSTVGGAD
jgi:hypothetical protein